MLELSKPLFAILTENIMYHTFEGKVKLKKGTLIIVDTMKQVAYCEGEHFSIDKAEYIFCIQDLSNSFRDKTS